MFTTPEALNRYQILMEHSLDGNDLGSYEFPILKMYIHPWLRDKTISIIASIKGVGKSWLALFIIRQLVYGIPFCRWVWENFADVVLLDMEMAKSDIEERWNLITKGIDYEPVMRFTIISADVLGMRGLAAPNLIDSNWREAVFHMLRLTMPNGGLFVIDNVSAATPGRSENEKDEWDDINCWLLKLKWELGIMTILCCHLPKSGNSPRGTSGMEDSNDTTITLTNIGKPDHAHFKVEFTKHRFFHGSEHIEPFTLELRPDATGRLELSTKAVELIPKVSNAEKIIRLVADKGLTQAETAQVIRCHPSHVSRVIGKAKSAGYLTKNRKFTGDGEKKYGSVDLSDINLNELKVDNIDS